MLETNRKRMAGSILQESMERTFTHCNIIFKYQLISPYDLINPDQDHVVASIKIRDRLEEERTCNVESS